MFLRVLNMKPPDILAMIEEAAWTKMYEAKKQQAEKTIEGFKVDGNHPHSDKVTVEV